MPYRRLLRSERMAHTHLLLCQPSRPPPPPPPPAVIPRADDPSTVSSPGPAELRPPLAIRPAIRGSVTVAPPD